MLTTRAWSWITATPAEAGPKVTVTNPTDAELVESCLSGTREAFDVLVERHQRHVYQLCYRFVGNHEDASDLAQDVFIRAYRGLKSFKGQASLGTWLYRLAMNQILDHVRSRAARTGQLTDGLDDASVLPDAGGHRLADRAIDRIDLERALAELPEGCRAAFVLHDVEGLEHKEVSEVLGIAEGTSKSQVHKARLRLRAMLARRK